MYGDLKFQEVTPFKAMIETCKCIGNQSKVGVKDIKEAKSINKKQRTLGTIRNQHRFGALGDLKKPPARLFLF